MRSRRGGAIGCGRMRSVACVVRTGTRRQYGGSGRAYGAARRAFSLATRTAPCPIIRASWFILARRVSVRIALALLVCVACTACTTGPPPPVSQAELAQGETFPYYKLYWVGRYFLGQPLTAVDGSLASYVPMNGESAYYGSCASDGGLLGEGACNLPLQITTLIYVPHSNRPLGTQENVILRGVPATIYDEGRSIALYTGHIEIELTAAERPERDARLAPAAPFERAGRRAGTAPVTHLLPASVRPERATRRTGDRKPQTAPSTTRVSPSPVLTAPAAKAYPRAARGEVARAHA